MRFLFALAIIFLPASLLAAPPAAKVFTISGEMAPIKIDDKPGTKRFELTVIVPLAAEADQTAPILWFSQAQGRGMHPWLMRFGLWKPLSANDFQTPPDQGLNQPYLYYEHQTGTSFVSLLFPKLTSPEALQVGTQWNVGRIDYQVTQEERSDKGNYWHVEGKGPASLRRHIQVDKESGLIHKLSEKRFLGQGHEQELYYEVVKQGELDVDQLQALQSLFIELGEIRLDLGLDDGEAVVRLQPQSLESLREPLEKLAKRGEGTLLAGLLTDANRDLRNRRDQAGALSALREAAIGNTLPEIETKDLTGRPISSESFQGKITILHFWEYKDTPLEQPYGQVAYLDFLQRKWKDKPQSMEVQIFGVHVDPDLGGEETHRSAVSRAKRLRDFMNLGYPIALDNGEWLKKIGDPRPSGGKLPLFVVLDKQGKVVEYHPDIYPVKGQEGLAELEAFVNKLLAPAK